MNVRKVQAIGVALGLALFVAIGLLLTTGPRPAPGYELRPGVIDPGVGSPAERLGDAFAMVAAHVKPCVVSVYSEKTIRFTVPELSDPFSGDLMRRFFGEPLSPPQGPRAPRREFRGQQRGMGSGMILDKRGHVLTNFHVVHDVDEIKVTLADKRSFAARVVGTDPKTDVAVLALDGQVPADLPTITLGDSAALRVGDLVLTIGAPFGLAQTVTEGIISATGRSELGVADYEDLLQTDAPINPGNSGGPLVNMRGEVIGMNTAIASSIGQYAGIGFAIPSNMIKALLVKLTNGQQIVRGQLGIGIQDMTRELADQFGLAEPKGALVSQIVKGSPAARAGLQIGDVVVRFDGKDVPGGRDLRNMVAAAAPGSNIKLGVIRNAKPVTVTVTIEAQPAERTEASPAPEQPGSRLDKLGIAVQALTPDLANQLRVDATRGVVITDVNEAGSAAAVGLHSGDVIVEANRTPVASPEDLVQVLTRAARDKRSVLLRVKRQDVSMLVVIPS
jgi:serine protease Do